SISSDADLDSWIESVGQLGKSQLDILAASDLAAENAVIVCDGIWFREYRKEATSPDWNRVNDYLKRLESFGHSVGIRTLEVAAIRTQIMLKAEFQDDIALAIDLAESALQRFDDAVSKFLITEVMGRQFFYAKRFSEAKAWLEKANSAAIIEHALLRRN